MQLSLSAQVLVDSIPYPEISQGFWGIQVNPDTIFLGADFSGDIYFSDHAGNITGQLATGFTFNHGLIRRSDSYLIAQDYAANGAHLHEVGFDGTLLNTWTFPDVIGGHSAGIGGICADGDAIWYTMYYPDFDSYPFAYAYKWIPGDPAPIDTVPMLGAQPFGITLKGDTLIYVMDNNDDDTERIYLYDLSTEQDLGYVDLPDVATDGDQSPRGLFWDGELLYLIANRSGGSAFAFQTVYIYAFDDVSGFGPLTLSGTFALFPNPSMDEVSLVMQGSGTWSIAALNGQHVRGGRIAQRTRIDLTDLACGTYIVTVETNTERTSRQLIVQ